MAELRIDVLQSRSKDSCMSQHGFGAPAPTRRNAGRVALGLLVLIAVLGAIVIPGGIVPHAHANAPDSSRDQGTSDTRPNVVVVMADDMRVDDLAFAPNVRRLIAADGLTFQNSFSPFPLCCPARASFLTGMYAHNHHVYYHKSPWGYRAFDDSRTLGTALSAVGYHTGFVGKYLNGYGPDRSLVSGMKSYKYVPNGWTDWMVGFQHPSGVPGIHGNTYNYFDTPYNVNGRVDNSHKGQYQTNVIGRFSRKLVAKYHQSSAPFFLYVSFVAPHHGAPREHGDPVHVRKANGRYEKFVTPARPDWVKGKFNRIITRGAGLPRNGGPSEADISDKPSFLRHHSEPNAAERAALKNVTRQRAEAVYVLDQQVGRLVSTLKKTGEWDNTVLMFTSDNGYFLGEHRKRQGKILPHEPSLRVPFLVTGPGMRTPQMRYDPISTVDITATIADIAQAAPPRTPDGISRWDSMQHGDEGWTVPVVTEAYHSIRSRRTAPGFDDPRTSIGLRLPRYSFTIYQDGEGELYDLVNDPAEMTNQYDQPAYRSVRDALTQLWWQYKNCGGATCRTPAPTEFQASASREAQWTTGYWNAINRMYGWQ